MGLVICLLITILITIIILGVRMETALANARQALEDLNTTISNLPAQTDHSADVQAIADGINAAAQSLRDRFPA